jgi:hypothetical protein
MADKLHLTKVAFGCANFDELRERITTRLAGGSELRLSTRYKPRRAEELIGGSLFWIAKHRLGVRQTILGFDEGEGGRCLIRLDAQMVSVLPITRRAHQGWRYLAGNDAPADLTDGAGAEDRIPPMLEAELAALGLI